MEALIIIVPVFIVLVVLFLMAQFDRERRKKREREMQRRHAYVQAKYRDPGIVNMIMNRMLWQGQTTEQLRDSLGNPEDVDEKVLKTKTKHIWKYHQTGRNRFGLKITVENNVVVGWDKKD